MNRLIFSGAACLVVAVLAGCGAESSDSSVKTPAAIPVAPAIAPAPPTEAADAPTNADGLAVADAPVAKGPVELKVEGFSFWVPAAWKRVEPPSSRIVEAEFTIPRAEGDEFDGRLTLMAAGGDNDANIARWTGEFNQAPGQGAKVETIKIAGREAIRVDIRGEWKGSSFNRIDPRPDYRMIALIIPFNETSSYFLKLNGPRATIAAIEEDFKTFANSARVRD